MLNNCSSVAVFCGSSDGKDAKYVALAADFGAKCAKYQLDIYYGGAKLGLMNAVAEAAIQNGGKVIGVMPKFFINDVVAASYLTELISVESMSERKQMMEKKSDAFVILPGSFGTMDEFFEVVTDAQLGLHQKPIVILNAFGYYDALLLQIERFEKEGFLRPFHRGLITVAESVEDVFVKIGEFRCTNDQAWLDKHCRG